MWVGHVLKVRRALQRQDQPGSALLAQVRPGRHPLLRQAPPERPDADPVTREAYSHEVISFRFWPGDRNVRERAFYSYSVREPEGLTEQPLRPPAARGEGGTAFLTYEEVRKSSSPRETLLEFLHSAYEAGAKAASWILKELRAAVGWPAPVPLLAVLYSLTGTPRWS